MVNIYPVKASGFFRESFPEERDVLIKSGIMPINDVFKPHYGDRSNLRLFYGGYGSGKSVFIAQDLISKCLNDKYFKCYYGRKVFEAVHHSCFETLVETIEDLGLEQYFKYSKADNSTMVIRCVINDNKFIPFGSDKPDKLKSIKDPSHIWCEEFDQFEEGEGERHGDFQILYPRLRTVKAETEFIASFNTSPVYSRHWILKYFFPELYAGDEKPSDWFLELFSELKISKCFANYTDNFFIDQPKYYKQLQLASGGSMSILNAIAAGAWGVSENKAPWLYAFDEAKHVKKIAFIPGMPVYIFIDVNNDPFEATVWQHSSQFGGSDSFIHCIKEYSGKYKVEELCARIKSDFPASIIYVGGDRSGQNQDVGRNQTIYQIIQSLLGLRPVQMLLNTYNLEHADSRILMNMLIANYPHFAIDKSCVNYIHQCKIATVSEKEGKPQQLLKDRGTYKMDAFDSGRYYFQTIFNEWVKKNYLRALYTKPSGKHAGAIAPGSIPRSMRQ